MPNRPVTPGYIVFYILFLPDTWQLIAGFIASGLISPRIMPPDFDSAAQIVVFFMIAAIGYTASRPLGKWIAGALKKIILGNKSP